MGGCLSSKSRTRFSNIRVVHLNGYVEVFEERVTVSQVTGKTPKHFMFSRSQFLSPDSKPLDPGSQLQLGNIYYLLPYSTFRSEVSPMDFAAIARRLTTIAKSGRSDAKSAQANLLKSLKGSCPLGKSYEKSPNRFAGRYATTTSPNRRFSDSYVRAEPKEVLPLHGSQKPCNSSPCWKPVLGTIRERSFNHRSESDLQENHLTKVCNSIDA